MASQILIADDDGHIREVLRFSLEQSGYLVTEAADGLSAWKLFSERHHGSVDEKFDAVILDVIMPEYDGLELCRKIRSLSEVPIIFLSSRDEEFDRVLGLELGADDYVSKPFSPREVAARVKASLRRYKQILQMENLHRESLVREEHGSAIEGKQEGHFNKSGATSGSTEILRWSNIQIDTLRHRCFVADSELSLTATEFAFLVALLSRPGLALSRSRLVELVYGEDHFLSDRTIDSHIRRLRAKLIEAEGSDPIETVYGVGYRLKEIE